MQALADEPNDLGLGPLGPQPDGNEANEVDVTLPDEDEELASGLTEEELRTLLTPEEYNEYRESALPLENVWPGLAPSIDDYSHDKGKVHTTDAHTVPTDADVQVWNRWIEKIHTDRQLNPQKFAYATEKHEDLQYGPSDSSRIGNTGFERVGHAIQWQINGASEMWSAARLLEKIGESPAADFYPVRKKRVLVVPRDYTTATQHSKNNNTEFYGGAFTLKKDPAGLNVRGPDGHAETERMGRLLYDLTYARDEDGQKILKSDGKWKLQARARRTSRSTDSLRLQVLSIRLNQSHWEWGFRRWMETPLFDTPSMTPHETATQGLPTAIPLLTLGSLNFSGLLLKQGDGNEEGTAPELAVKTPQDLQALSIEKIRALPRVQRQHAIDKLSGVDVLHTVTVNSATSTNGPVKVGVLLSNNPFTWKTVFAVTMTDKTFYYTNILLAKTETVKKKFGASGYGEAGLEDSDGINGELRSTFLGKPMFFALKKDEHGSPEDVRVQMPTDAQVKNMDKAVRDRGMTHRPLSYGEVYRELFFAPQPIRSLTTFPACDASFCKEKHFLKFDIDRSNDHARSKQDDRMIGPSRKNAPPGKVRMCPMPAFPEENRRQLRQRYPEVVLWTDCHVESRAKQAMALYDKILRGTCNSVQPPPWFINLAHQLQTVQQAAPQGSSGIRHKSKTVVKSNWANWKAGFASHEELSGMLGPSTIEEAMQRFAADYNQDLPYGSTVDKTPKKVQKPGGIYYSCRVDTGKEAGKGGLDSLLPLSQDADVYAIADVELARGVHDYVNDARDDEYGKRAGPPEWWTKERRKLLDAMNENAKAVSYLKRVTPLSKNDSMWIRTLTQEGRDEVALQRWKDATGADGKDGLSNLQLRRLDSALVFPEESAQSSLMGAMDRAISRATKNLPVRPKGVDYMPTALHVGTGVSKEAFNIEKKTEGRLHSAQTVLFDTFWQDPTKTPREQAVGIVDSLPHRSDAEMPKMPVYPALLSSDAKYAAWRRLCAAKVAECNNTGAEVQGNRRTEDEYQRAPSEACGPDMPVPGLGSRLKGFDDARLANGYGRTLTAPLYVVALNFDDFAQARTRGYGAWHAFFDDPERKNYLEKKDMYEVLTSTDGEGRSYLIPNKKYVHVSATYPPRESGTAKTFDAPEQGAPFPNAIRPAERMRASWFSDWNAFGGSIETHAEFVTAVNDWCKLYKTYSESEKFWSNIETANEDAMRHNSALRIASIELFWNISVLLGTNGIDELLVLYDLAQDLSTSYDGDELTERNLPSIDDANSFHGDQISDFHTRLPLVVFFIDLLDQAKVVREECKWLQRKNSELITTYEDGRKYSSRTEEREILRGNVATPFADDLTSMSFDWSLANMDLLLKQAGAKVALLLTWWSALSVSVQPGSDISQFSTGCAHAWTSIRQKVNEKLSPTSGDIDSRYTVNATELQQKVEGASLQYTGSHFESMHKLIVNPEVAHPMEEVFQPILYAFFDSWYEYIYELRTDAINTRVLANGHPHTEYYKAMMTNMENNASPKAMLVPRSERGDALDAMREFFGQKAPLKYRRELDVLQGLLDAHEKAHRYHPLRQAPFKNKGDADVLISTTSAFTRVFTFLTSSTEQTAIQNQVIERLRNLLKDTPPTTVDPHAVSDLNSIKERVLQGLGGDHTLIPGPIARAFHAVEEQMKANQPDLDALKTRKRRLEEQSVGVQKVRKRMQGLKTTCRRVRGAMLLCEGIVGKTGQDWQAVQAKAKRERERLTKYAGMANKLLGLLDRVAEDPERLAMLHELLVARAKQLRSARPRRVRRRMTLDLDSLTDDQALQLLDAPEKAQGALDEALALWESPNETLAQEPAIAADSVQEDEDDFSSLIDAFIGNDTEERSDASLQETPDDDWDEWARNLGLDDPSGGEQTEMPTSIIGDSVVSEMAQRLADELDDPKAKAQLQKEIDGGHGKRATDQLARLENVASVLERRLAATEARVSKELFETETRIRVIEDSICDVIAAVERVQPEPEEVERLNDELKKLTVQREEDVVFLSSANEDIADISPYEVGGWKGAYRLYVAKQIRVRGVYSVDSLPMSPRQWLESDLGVGNWQPKLPPDPALPPPSIDMAVTQILNPAAPSDEKERVRLRLKELLEFLDKDSGLLVLRPCWG